MEPLCQDAQARLVDHLPFVEALARRVAASMPNSVELNDLVQDGMLGLIDAVQRFDESRGIRFVTFAERRVRGAMIDALRRAAWPRGVRRLRRQLDEARDRLRREHGREPTLADLAEHLGTTEERLGRAVVRIRTIESTSAAGAPETGDYLLPAICLPPETVPPDAELEAAERCRSLHRAIAQLPARERRLINLYYYGGATMKEIGAEIGVNESRVSQLHARAVARLRQALAPDREAPTPSAIATTSASGSAVVDRAHMQSPMARARVSASTPRDGRARQRAVLPYPETTSRAIDSRSPRRNGLASQRHPLSSRNREASSPTTSPVTNTTRRARLGVLSAMAR
ncbi:MAG: FliA/WhiG family RNA polymerase sigma factor [Luteitalea sp.]|nr:FliA/WhiG family RNA polymerase sigma factor [Luteitalea sp.]